MVNQVARADNRGPRLAICLVLTAAALIFSGCRKDGGDNKSVVSTPTPSENSATSQSTAATSEGVPVGPTGQTTPSPEPTPATLPNGDPVAPGLKPAIIPGAPLGNKPAEDRYKPQPTPTLVFKDGKVVQQWQAPAEALSLVNPVKNSPDAATLGREWYNQRCVDCHGKEGKGTGWLAKGIFKPPTNLASQMVQANSDGELYWKITNGRSPMPASRIRFSDEQRWQIVTYLRTLRQ